MPILRKHQRSTYTVLDNHALRDTQLSWRATGMLAYLLSLPEDWNVNIEDLTRRKTDGRTATRSGLQELKDAGYVRLVEGRDGKGRFRRYLDVHETCQSITAQNPHDSSLFTDDGLPDFGETDFGESDTKKETERITENQLPNKTLPRDLIWDTLTATLGQPTSATLQGRVVKELHQAGIEPDELARIMERVVLAWGPGKLTLASVGKHFQRFRDSTPAANITQTAIDEIKRKQESDARRQAMLERISQ